MTRLLVVEDSATQAELVRFTLESAGFEVHVASDGPAALLLVQQHDFDIVLSDVNMPEMSGYELCARLKGAPDTQQLPVILLTSRSDPLAIIRGLECGADNFITKPYEPAYLIERVESILNARKQRLRKLRVGVDVTFLGRQFVITSEKEQIIDLLISTFEEIVRANRDLQARTEELHSILDSIGDGVMVADRDGSLILSNRTAELILGADPMSNPPDHWPSGYGFFALDRRTPVAPEELPLQRAIRGEASDDVETFVRSPGAAEGTYLSITGRPMRNDIGQVRGGVIAFRDISERKRVEDLMTSQAVELARAKQRAEQESKYKSRFLASMSHELRTPLNAIIGFSELLDQESFGPLNERQKEYVGYVMQGGKHLLTLVNDILDLSKVEAGRMELAREWVSPQLVLDSIRGVVQPLAIKYGVTVEVEPGSDLREIYVDPVRLKQILYNLISNGIKFTPRGGKVTVRAESRARQICISVADTGIGIKPEDMHRLFREFEQIDQDSSKSEGTGLGLALTKRLVEMHDGSIAVESQPGIGTKFSVMLPVYGGESQEPARALAEAPPVQAPVLVIDDDPLAAELIARPLRTAGLTVVTALDARKALALAEKLAPAAITLDIKMLGMDGWGVLTQLKRRASTAHIPVIIVSMADETSRALLLGASDYLVKPVARNELLLSLETIGVALHRIDGVRVLLAGEGADVVEAEAHLRAARCEVTRVARLSGVAPTLIGQADVVITGVSEATLAEIEALQMGSETHQPPIIALIDGEQKMAEQLASLAKLPRGDAREPDQLVRVVREAIRARLEPDWYAGTGLPGPSSLLAHLRSSIGRAEADGRTLLLAAAHIKTPKGPVPAPSIQLLWQRLRHTDFVAAGSESCLVLVVHGPVAEDEQGIAERFRALISTILGLDVLGLSTLHYRSDGFTAEELFEACRTKGAA